MQESKMWRTPLEDMSSEEDNLRNVMAGNMEVPSTPFAYLPGNAVANLSFESPASMTVTRSRAAFFSNYVSQAHWQQQPGFSTHSPTTSTPSMNTRLQTAVREGHQPDPVPVSALLTPPPDGDGDQAAESASTTHDGSPDQLLKSREMLIHASPVKKCLLMNHAASRSEVTNQMRALSHDQAIQMLLTLYQSSTTPLTQQIQATLPKPDLRPSIHTLNTLQKSVYRSIPTSRTFRLSSGGSNRDAMCFRVTRHNLAEFKNACLDQAQNLVNLEQWDLVVDYVLKAWKYVDDLPDWDNPAHNSYKQLCFRGLCKHCHTALTHLGCDSDTHRRLHEKLTWANNLSCEMKPCLKLLERQMSTPPASWVSGDDDGDFDMASTDA